MFGNEDVIFSQRQLSQIPLEHETLNLELAPRSRLGRINSRMVPGTTWRIIPVGKWLGSPPFISHSGHLEGKAPHLGDLRTMVINHLQVMGWSSKYWWRRSLKSPEETLWPCKSYKTLPFPALNLGNKPPKLHIYLRSVGPLPAINAVTGPRLRGNHEKTVVLSCLEVCFCLCQKYFSPKANCPYAPCMV